MDKVQKTLTAKVSDQSTSKSSVNIVFKVSNNTGIGNLDVVTSSVTYNPKGKVKSAPAIKAGSKVVGRSGNDITVQIPKPGLKKDLPNNTVITFTPDPTNNRITFSTDLGTAIAKNTVLSFNNPVADANVLINSKLKIGSRYLKTGDLILLNNENDVRLYQVTSPVNTGIFSDGQAVTVTFTKVNLLESAIYVYGTSNYRYVGSSLFEVDKVQTVRRFNYKIAPQYAITE
jgi:hypothetical protein